VSRRGGGRRAALWAGAAAGLAALAGGGWLAYDRLTRPAAPAAVQLLPEPDDPPEVAAGVEAVDGGDGEAVDRGSTPMAERVAVLGLLNKRNGASRDLALRPGQAVRAGDVVVRLAACERTAPWEPEPLTGAFVQLDVRGPDRRWRRAFSGWLYKERPALNVVQHPVYDVWAKSCTTSFPDTGPDTVPLDGARAPGRRSRAPKSPAAEGAAPAPPNAVPASAEPSRAI